MTEQNYFINCSSKSIEYFAAALLSQVNEPNQCLITDEETVMEYAGNTSVEQIYEDENCVLMVSVDFGITVLNIVSKSNEDDIQSIEL